MYQSLFKNTLVYRTPLIAASVNPLHTHLSLYLNPKNVKKTLVLIFSRGIEIEQ